MIHFSQERQGVLQSIKDVTRNR